MKTLKNFLKEQKEELPPPFIEQIRKYTHFNDHFKARAYIATLMGNKKLAKLYDSLEKLHHEFHSYMGNDVIDIRSKLEINLKNDIRNYYSNWEKIIRAL